MNLPASSELIPVLPESAPFTPEQRAYLNGFLAGLFSRAPAPGAMPQPDQAKSLLPLAVLYGSQTGNCEALARRISKEAGRHGFVPTLHELGKYPTAQLASERSVLFVTSTYGDGEPPDNAKAFWDWISSSAAPKLSSTRFALLALGDSNYPKFCGFGKALEARLDQLGAQRVLLRADCDVDFEADFQKWLIQVLPALAAHQNLTSQSPANLSTADIGPPRAALEKAAAEHNPSPAYSRANPFPARLVATRRLCDPGSGKDVRHVEISLEGSDLTYEAGDALGVFPQNDSVLVDEILRALDCDGEEAVPGKAEVSVPLRLALLEHYEITRIPRALLGVFAEKTQDPALRKVTAPEANGDLTQFLHGREIIDLLLGWPQVKLAPAEFIAQLRKLQPRLYSISSSPKRYPHQVHLTIGVVSYHTHGRERRGVCSTHVAERVRGDMPMHVFVHANKAFRPPPSDIPLIMIGPGTGIAPFRAFLQERQCSRAPGQNWLFFGDQRAATDFLYRDEIDALVREGVLQRLDLAFSRDQDQKVYVQHRMLEHGKELFAWLEEGAAVYVCGDASRMARDVDQALHRAIELAGGFTPAQAADYVKELQAQKRYQRDVY